MKIGILAPDSHNFPNLPIMKISAYHKAQGNSVEWWKPEEQYDAVYCSVIFSETEVPRITNAAEVHYGGSGIDLKKQPSGRDRTRNAGLFNISGLRFRGGLPYARLPALKSRAIPRRVLHYAGQRRVQGSEGCRSFRILDGAKENIAFGSKFACVQRTPYRSIATACRVRR